MSFDNGIHEGMVKLGCKCNMLVLFLTSSLIYLELFLAPERRGWNFDFSPKSQPQPTYKKLYFCEFFLQRDPVQRQIKIVHGNGGVTPVTLLALCLIAHGTPLCITSRWINSSKFMKGLLMNMLLSKLRIRVEIEEIRIRQ